MPGKVDGAISFVGAQHAAPLPGIHRSGRHSEL